MKLSFLLIPLAFLSCKTVKNFELTNKSQKETIVSLSKELTHNIEISINTREPYCGGAYPRAKDLNKFSVKADKYLLINIIKNDTTTIKSDSLGMVYLNLEKGNYEIRELYKDMPLTKFQKENQPNENESLLITRVDCYKNWWKENLLKFDVKENTDIINLKATINKRCFTGKNPCVTYNGRLPK